MAEAAGRLAKPQMRGLLHAAIKRNIFVAIGLSLVTGAVFKYTVAEPRKKRYADFYRNYDPEEDFRNMVKSGADFQCLE